MIIAAAQFAFECHKGQTRKYSGRPYIEHPARVASRLMTHYVADEINVAAAWLHDVHEDCDVSLSKITDLFGLDVSHLVKELSNPSKGSSLSRAARKKMDRDHLRSVSRDAKIIKLIDRIDNLRDIPLQEYDFRTLYEEESLLLAEVLRDADEGLAEELFSICTPN